MFLKVLKILIQTCRTDLYNYWKHFNLSIYLCILYECRPVQRQGVKKLFKMKLFWLAVVIYLFGFFITYEVKSERFLQFFKFLFYTNVVCFMPKLRLKLVLIWMGCFHSQDHENDIIDITTVHEDE